MATMTDEEMRLRLLAFHKCLGDLIFILLAAGTGHLVRDLWIEHQQHLRDREDDGNT